MRLYRSRSELSKNTGGTDTFSGYSVRLHPVSKIREGNPASIGGVHVDRTIGFRRSPVLSESTRKGGSVEKHRG